MGVGDPPSPGVHADEIGMEGFHDFPGNFLGHSKEAVGFFLVQVMPPGNMPFGDDQAVALSQRVDIQQGQGQIILLDDMGRRLSGGNITKDAFFFRHGRSPSRGFSLDKLAKSRPETVFVISTKLGI